MRRKLASLLLMLSLFGLVLPAATQAQDGGGYGRYIKRTKNGVRVGDNGISFFDGPGIVNYTHRNRWMDSPAGVATVVGVGAGAGAVAGGVTRGKKGAVVGALIGAGAATGVWLYKNRTVKRRIF